MNCATDLKTTLLKKVMRGLAKQPQRRHVAPVVAPPPIFGKQIGSFSINYPSYRTRYDKKLKPNRWGKRDIPCGTPSARYSKASNCLIFCLH